uniref:Doublecortin domain-containing protein n=1 Tax=Ciona savignyi TaxID=51511 RepID=H2Z435_CIOSA
MMNSLDLVLSEITEKISLRTGKAVRRLYDVTYKQINDPSQLTQGQYYIAVGTEQLKKLPYGELNSMQKSQSPRRGNALPPIKRHRPRPPQKDGDDQTYTKLHNQRKQQKQEEEETTVMGASAVTGYRPLKTKKYKPKPPASHPTHEGESVFHAKPVKVKRSGKMNHIPHPPSAESDGVFRANGEGIRAEEVQEDEDTKVDLPIDQVPADAVDEEEIQDHPNADANGNDDVDEDVTVDVAASNADEYREKDVGNESDGGFDDNVATEEDNSAPVPTAAPVPLPITNIEDEVVPEDELVQEKPDEIVESEPVEDLDEVPAENTPQNDAVKATEERHSYDRYRNVKKRYKRKPHRQKETEQKSGDRETTKSWVYF